MKQRERDGRFSELEINNESICKREFRQTDPLISSNFLSIDENHRAYVNFVSSLKSPITRKAYVIRLKNYLRSPIISFSTFDELLSRDRHVIEQGIIDILINMRHEMDLSFSAQNIFLCASTHFFSINDVTINRKKIKKITAIRRINMNIVPILLRKLDDCYQYVMSAKEQLIFFYRPLVCELEPFIRYI